MAYKLISIPYTSYIPEGLVDHSRSRTIAKLYITLCKDSSRCLSWSLVVVTAVFTIVFLQFAPKLFITVCSGGGRRRRSDR